MENLGYLDFIFLGVIALIAIRGVFAGFAKELFGILGVVVGIFFASRFAYDAGVWFKERVYDFDSQTFDTLIGFIFIFIFIWIIAVVLGVLFKRLMDSVLPKYANVILGGVFGALKSYLMLAIILYFALNFDFMKNAKAHIFQNSVFYSSMDCVASKIIGSKLIAHAPKDAKEVKEELNHLKETTIQEAKTKLQEGVETLQEGAKEVLEGGKEVLEGSKEKMDLEK